MKIAYELPEPYGGRLMVTDSELVPLGDAMAHKQLTYRRNGTSSVPGCEIVFEVHNGVPQCVSLSLSAVSGEYGVRPKDLSSISLEKMRDDFFAYAGIYRPNPDGGWVHTRGTEALFRQDRKVVENAGAQQRRKMTPELKHRVADIYNNAPAGTRIAAIRAAFGLKQSQALRYKKAAMEAGLIDRE